MRARCAAGQPPPAPAAALLALFPSDGDVHVVLTRRSVALPTHPGEVALPGGRVQTGEAMVDAALREAREEVGIDPGDVEVVGWLDRVTGRTSGSVATPIVGLLAGPPQLVPEPAEVEAVFTVGLEHLRRVHRQEVWDVPVPGLRGPNAVDGIVMHFFDLGHDVVWGMTARVLHELLVVLSERTAQQASGPARAREGTTPPAPA